MAHLIATFDDTFTLIDYNIAFCNCCSENIVFLAKRQKLQVYIDTKKHQQNIKESSSKEFFKDICQAFVSTNIPLSKLNNPSLQDLFKKYTGRRLPDKSTIRKLYLLLECDNTIAPIKDNIFHCYIWISTDETTDIKDGGVVNVVVDTLDPQRHFRHYLVSTEFRNTVNTKVIFEIIKEAIFKLSNSPEKVLHFVSDAAAVMLKTTKLLRQQFSNALHLTCLADGLHRICAFIRKTYPDVNVLINNFRKVLLQHLAYLYIKKCFPNLCLPPQPVITRWGSWLEAVFFIPKISKTYDLL